MVGCTPRSRSDGQPAPPEWLIWLYGIHTGQQSHEFRAAMFARGLQRRETVKVRHQVGISTVREQVMRHLIVSVDQAGDEGRAQDLRVLAVGIDALADVVI